MSLAFDRGEFERQSAFAAKRAVQQRGHLEHCRWTGGHLEFIVAPNRRIEQIAEPEHTGRRGVAQGRLL